EDDAVRVRHRRCREQQVDHRPGLTRARVHGGVEAVFDVHDSPRCPVGYGPRLPSPPRLPPPPPHRCLHPRATPIPPKACLTPSLQRRSGTTVAPGDGPEESMSLQELRELVERHARPDTAETVLEDVHVSAVRHAEPDAPGMSGVVWALIAQG